MSASVGIRELKQYTSRVVAQVAAGEAMVITDRGRPVAQLVPLVRDRAKFLVDAGLAVAPSKDIQSLPRPVMAPDGVSLSESVTSARDEERY
jgi:prevent-host-death family protein